MSFGLSHKNWNTLDRVVIKPLKNCGANLCIFGSRARGDYKEYSDIDILVQGNLPKGMLSQIKFDLENSNLPIKVDIVEDEFLAESYRKQVDSEKVPI